MENQEINSRKNKKKLEHEGCLYIFHKLNADGDVKFWRCEHQHGDVKCRGRVHTSLNDVVMKTVGEHSCQHSAANVAKQQIVTGIKRRAAETMETPAAIRAHALQQNFVDQIFGQ
uniref:FLYWCH-type domain-containing protein n=1 Tax=Globodera rostochiensis TaxID=31243 RepID=A0A914GPP4_GLORO